MYDNCHLCCFIMFVVVENWGVQPIVKLFSHLSTGPRQPLGATCANKRTNVTDQGWAAQNPSGVGIKPRQVKSKQSKSMIINNCTRNESYLLVRGERPLYRWSDGPCEWISPRSPEGYP